MGTALVVTIMTSRATALVGDGAGPVAASLGGMRWAFAVSAALSLGVLALVFLLPSRIDDPDASGSGEPVDDLDEEFVAVCSEPEPV